MDSAHSTTGNVSSKQLPRERHQISQLVEQVRFDLHQGASLNRSASSNGVARSTAQIWIRNRSRLEQKGGLAPAKFSFFELPQRLEFLHRLLCALHLVLGQANDGGIRSICWLLELCQRSSSCVDR